MARPTTKPTALTAPRLRGRAGQQQRQRILKRDCGQCVHCLELGRATIATEVDHIIGIAQGGTHDDANLQSLCHDCHSTKTATDNGKRSKPHIGLDGIPLSPGHHWSK